VTELEQEATRELARTKELPESDKDLSTLATEDLEATLTDVEREVEGIRERASRLRGQVEERTRTLPSVAETEEAREAAREALERVQRLDRVLEKTAEHLRRAQETVHRDIAPRLAETVRQKLADVTAGRYVDASVDPATLEVKVQERDGSWRDANRVSYGTREQVYLLLRLALGRHLAVPGEVCPLLLDDVTAHSDRGRTRAVLELLHQASHACQGKRPF
jgi:uncharacterized protein YhaN